MKPLDMRRTDQGPLFAAPADAAPHPAQRFVIKRLRGLIPQQSHPLSWIAAERVIEAQSALTAQLAHHAKMTPSRFVASLPIMRIEQDADLPDSGLSYWDDIRQEWVIIVRASESTEQQQFSILHEFKHIIDHGHESHLYDPRYLQGHVQSEMAADYFAASTVMPRAKVRAAIADGAITIAAIARYFRTSKDRAALRLSDLALTASDKNQSDPNPGRRKSS